VRDSRDRSTLAIRPGRHSAEHHWSIDSSVGKSRNREIGKSPGQQHYFYPAHANAVSLISPARLTLFGWWIDSRANRAKEDFAAAARSRGGRTESLQPRKREKRDSMIFIPLLLQKAASQECGEPFFAQPSRRIHSFGIFASLTLAFPEGIDLSFCRSWYTWNKNTIVFLALSEHLDITTQQSGWG
jgi:hypothetical protein